ncbi:MAG TPA: glycosyltransferase family 87 protein, partial [Roseiflexaceae bacterium]
IAWWMAPVYQIVMTADGAPNVNPPPATLWIGGLAALPLAGLGLWYAFGSRGLSREHARRIVSKDALAVLALAALAHLAYMIWFAFQRQGPDFWILFKGARDWARGGSLYNIPAVVENHFGHVFKVPPFYGMLFVPFVGQDGERILFFHRALNVILLAATAVVWLRMWRLPIASAAGAGMLILLNFRPMTDTMAFGQIDLALLLILTVALWALRSERDVLAGALIALGTLFKIYPVLLLAFLVAKRRWRGLIGFALGMLLLNGAAVAVMGWEMHRVYLLDVLPRIGGTTSWVENQTISGFLARFAAPPTASEIFRGRAIALAGLAISGLVGLLACVAALWPARPRSTTFALQYSAFPLLMVLVVPAAWMHYETLLFLPFAALLLHEREREMTLPRAAALALSFALIGYGNQWSFYDGTVMGILTVAGVSFKFYGMVLLGGVLGLVLAEQMLAGKAAPRPVEPRPSLDPIHPCP